MSISSQKVEEYVTALNLMYGLYGIRLGDEENVDGLSKFDSFHLVDLDGTRIASVKIYFNSEVNEFTWVWA